jgi:hypothetical protein
MACVDPSEQQVYRSSTIARPARATFLGDGGRLLLLAVGGFAIMRIAVALLQLG